MKLQLTKGEANVGVKHVEVDVPEHLKTVFKNGKRRGTEIYLTLPSGEQLTSKAFCDSADQFNKQAGKHHAILNLFQKDTDQAVEKVIADFDDLPIKRKEDSDLGTAAKKHYKLSREDRRLLFHTVCTEFFRNEPERKAIRERAQLDRLMAKFNLTHENCPKGVKVLHPKKAAK